MPGVFRHNAFQQWPRFRRLLLAQQALPEVRPRVNVLRVPLQRRPITRLGLVQFSLPEINVPQLKMMVRLVQVMDLRLQFLDPLAAPRPRQFKPPRGRRRGAIHEHIIKHRRETKADKNENRPNPFLPPHRVNAHPQLKYRHQCQPWIMNQKINIRQVCNQGCNHFRRLMLIFRPNSGNQTVIMLLLSKMNQSDWENRYQTGDMPWEKGAPSPGLVDFLSAHPDLPKGTVCVPGCGTGHDVRAWARAGFDATGYDIAPSAVRLA